MAIVMMSRSVMVWIDASPESLLVSLLAFLVQHLLLLSAGPASLLSADLLLLFADGAFLFWYVVLTKVFRCATLF